MEASFDGMRIKLANDFNVLMYADPPENQKVALRSLRQTIVELLGMCDPNDADDCNDLSDDVKLMEVTPGGRRRWR